MIRSAWIVACLLAAVVTNWSCAPKGAVGALTGGGGPGGKTGAAPIRVHPPVLYAGENAVSIATDAGLREIVVEVGEEDAHLVHVERTGLIPDCMGTWIVKIRVASSAELVRVRIIGKDCNGAELRPVILENVTWKPDRIIFPETLVGETSCARFVIGVSGWNNEAILDSITLPETLPVKLGEKKEPMRFPVTIPAGRTFWYMVCFTGETPGEYRFPVTTWMRREAPTPGLTTYPVSDTAIVRVVEPWEEKAE